MGWRWLFGRARDERGVVVGDDEFEFRVVGTSHHQNALAQICGGRTEEGVHDHFCAALLTPQPTNPHDRGAVAVSIHGLEVGHLPQDVAREFRDALRAGRFAEAACEAAINGGWYRGPDDQGYFGVRLNASLPFTLCSAQQWYQRRRI